MPLITKLGKHWCYTMSIITFKSFFSPCSGRYLLKNNLSTLEVLIKWDYIWIETNKHWFIKTGLRKRTDIQSKGYNFFISVPFINTLKTLFYTHYLVILKHNEVKTAAITMFILKWVHQSSSNNDLPRVNR